MDATLRARKDVRMNLTWVQADFQEWTTNEEKELAELDSSQCVERACTIMFNTSSLKLIGAINDTGTLIHKLNHNVSINNILGSRRLLIQRSSIVYILQISIELTQGWNLIHTVSFSRSDSKDIVWNGSGCLHI